MTAFVADAVAASAYDCVALKVRGKVHVKVSPGCPLAASVVGTTQELGRLIGVPACVTETLKLLAAPPELTTVR